MSIDSMFVHKMWDDDELSKMVKGGVPFPMLSDAGGKVGRIYGVSLLMKAGPAMKNQFSTVIDSLFGLSGFFRTC